MTIIAAPLQKGGSKAKRHTLHANSGMGMTGSVKSCNPEPDTHIAHLGLPASPEDPCHQAQQQCGLAHLER
eukprot:scaffold137678_cov21-Tisochrysis_lutea.AAC.1